MKARIINRNTIEVIEDFSKEIALIDYRFQEAISHIASSQGAIEQLLLKDVKTSKEQEVIEQYNNLVEQRASSLERLESFLPFVESVPPDAGECNAVEPYYEEVEGKILQSWEIIVNDQGAIKEKIKQLKEELAASDYKALKVYEATIAGEPDPYDAKTLFSERKAKRLKINELEKKLEKNETETTQTI